MGDWYYIGHYGQLGPLSREQIDDLIRDGVIGRETYLWRAGMADWAMADRVPELADTFQRSGPAATPPPPPTGPRPFVSQMPTPSFGTEFMVPAPQAYPAFSGIRSDRSRTAAGVLQLFLPGVGRMYLGYMAYGIIQLITAFCFVGCIWSFIDGIIILTGGVKLDGYGRNLVD